MTDEELDRACFRAANRLAKWRTIFAGWQLGTRSEDDPECQAVKDTIEARLLMRAEISALTKILLDHGIVTQRELTQAFTEEFDALSKMLETKFKGMRSTDDGIEFYDIPMVRETMAGWKE